MSRYSDLTATEKPAIQLHTRNYILHTIINNLTDGVIVADKTGNFICFNQAARDILGIGARRIKPEDWATAYGCYLPDMTNPYPAGQLPLARALHGEHVENEVIYIRNTSRPDGVFIQVNARPMLDEHGLLSGGIVTLRDITAARQLEIDKNHSDDRIRRLFRGFPIPTYIWQHHDNDFVLVDCNDAAERITGGTIRKTIGTTLTLMYNGNPEYQVIHNDFYECYHNQKTVKRAMSYRFSGTGEVKDLKVSYVYAPPDMVMVHTVDMTGQNHARIEMQKLTSAVEQTADSVVITDRNGLIEYVNPAFESTTGYSRAEVIGKSPRLLKSGKHDRSFYKRLWNTILQGKPYRGIIVNKKKNGELYWCEQTITAMKDGNGAITHFVSVIKDITLLKKKQELDMRLRIAHEIQQKLLKATITLPGFDIAGATFPAVETSGDFYDFITLQDGSFGLVIGDVCGHGIGAALIMAQTRAYLRAYARMESDPAVILTLLNRDLVNDLDNNNFVTLVLARLNPQQKILDYASAGHPPGFIIAGDGHVAELPGTGIPLGFMADYHYEKSPAIPLSPGHNIVFITDGIVEAKGGNQEEFGFERTLAGITKYQKSKAMRIIKQLVRSVRDFADGHAGEDDMTAIVCKVLAEN
ncbi:MAG TPA: SpoIIE family protein phosphatase [bacterium]|nr:SpoIIE family protein phosphatase [bacterium]HPN42459.1 SpoIIE family protein phosphatase [bacterium]